MDRESCLGHQSCLLQFLRPQSRKAHDKCVQHSTGDRTEVAEVLHVLTTGDYLRLVQAWGWKFKSEVDNKKL